MRSTLLVIASGLVVLVAFLAYSGWQTGKPISTTSSSSHADRPIPSPNKSDGSYQNVKSGLHPWVWTNDDLGRPKNRFTSDDYRPQANGTIQVTNPIAEFYMWNNHSAGQDAPRPMIMRMSGKTGEVVMPGGTTTSQNAADNFVAGSPDRGDIDDVTIEIFNMFPDSDPKVADETITTRKLQFDNATRLITTEGYMDASGHMITGDWVPVHMKSSQEHRGYDFDGKGLTLRWNDTDGRLDLLRVEHGEQLIVKDTSSASGVFGGGKQNKSPPPAAVTPLVTTGAVAHEAKPPEAQPAAKVAANKPASLPANATPPPLPVPYVATFYDDVRITQGDDVLITAKQMVVDFVNRQSHEPNSGAPTSAEPKSGGASASAAPAVMPKVEVSVPLPTPPLSLPTSAAAATRPASPPVIIRWTGKLVMLSAQPDRPKVVAGDAIVQLTGEPVVVHRTPAGQREGDDVQAAKLTYHTGDGSVKLERSQAIEHVVISKLIDKKPDPTSTVTTDTLDYMNDATGKKVAILTGPGHAMMPIQGSAKNASATKPATVEAMDTRWETQAKVFFIGKGQDEQAIDHVDLLGDVDVKHPQLAMHSEALSLYFAPPAKKAEKTTPSLSAATNDSHGEKAQQELKRVVASREVHCVMLGQNGKSQTIDCDDLEMQTARSADGKFYARQVNASGSVHAFDADQELRGGVVEMTLKPTVAKTPTTKPAKDESDTAAAELEKMVARDNVSVKNKEGSVATGNLLVVTTENNQNHIRLTGSPNATVIDARNNMIVGPVIIVEQGVAHVVGAGTMHVLQEQSDGAKPKPMDVAWTNRADMNGKGNRVDIAGGVSVTTYDADGTVNVANGDRVQIDLVEKAKPAHPATQPTAHLAANDPKADSMQMDVMKDKDAQRITIDGKAQVVSTLRASNGAVARQFALYGPKIIYQLLEAKDLPASTLLVPSAGRMYVGDHRPPEKAKPGDTEEDSGARGDTAFQWSKRLIYGQLQREAIMSGNVLVVHQPLGKAADQDRVRINADRMTATFEPQKHDEKPATKPAIKPAPQPATRPARPGQPSESLQLKHLTCDGHVVITRPTGATLSAERVDFDPLTHWMYAHGSESNPAKYVDPTPHTPERVAREIQWNTQTWDMKASDTTVISPK